MILPSNTIGFQRNTTYLGRNGQAKCIAIELSEEGDDIIFTPINSKGGTGSCELVLPKENIQDLINTLESLKQQTNP